MALRPTYRLSVALATFEGERAVGVPVTVEMVTPELVYPVGSPAETLYPTTQTKHTDASGSAEFDLLPSATAGDYRILIGPYSRVISMPAADSRLSELGEPATPADDE